MQLQTKDDTWMNVVDELEPQDNHDYQTFSLDSNTTLSGTALKFVLNDFTDFYGRVTIYRMEVWGKEVVPTSLESSS